MTENNFNEMFISCTKLLLLIALNIHLCYCRNYCNYILLRALPKDDEHLDFLKNLTEFYDVNIWQDPGLKNYPVDFVISPADYDIFAVEAKKLSINYNTLIENIEEAFKQQTVKVYLRRNMLSYDWTSFFRLHDMYQWLQDLSQLYKDEVELIKIGKTAEGRDLLAVRVVLKGSDTSSKVIIEGGVHAREWISPAFVTFMIYQIVTAKDSPNHQLRNVALSYEWYFVPMLNPDGYEYTHKEDRLWRKNRNPHGAVDINRNFDSAFGTNGISMDKNKVNYCGERAFTEHESKAMKKFVTKHAKSLKYYLAFHSYGQYIILPYLHSDKHFLNFDEVYQMANITNQAISQRYKTIFSIGTAYETVGYKASGGSGDWVKKEFNTPYVMYFELRDKGRHGFALPTEQILPTCFEMMDGMLALIRPLSSSSMTSPSDETLFAVRHLSGSQDHAIFINIVTLIFTTLLWIISMLF